MTSIHEWEDYEKSRKDPNYKPYQYKETPLEYFKNKLAKLRMKKKRAGWISALTENTDE